MDQTPLALAVNAAMDDFRSIIASNFRKWAGGQGLDTKRRCSWSEYGWPETICFDDLHKLYSRQGIAFGVVNRLVKKCFQSNPWVIQGDESADSKSETAWDVEFKRFAKDKKFWKALRQVDTRRLVGRYAALILQIADGKQWDQPISSGSLVRFIPAWQGQLTVKTWDTSPTSATYGQPTMWTFDEAAVDPTHADSTAPAGRQVDIHPDRIIIFGDFREGLSYLEPCYNDFVNLEKISGGSGESFLKNAARQMAVNFDKEIDLGKIARAYGVETKDLQEAFQGAAHDLSTGGDRLMITQGADVSTLVAAVPDPEPHYSVSLQNIAASTGQPAKVIVGMQTGERASSEDLRGWNQECQGRRETDLADDIESAVNHLIRVKIVSAVPGGVFTVMWDNLAESTESEKADLADKYAGINQKLAGTGEAAPFTTEEIRNAAGKENAASLAPLPDVSPGPLPSEVQ